VRDAVCAQKIALLDALRHRRLCAYDGYPMAILFLWTGVV